MSRTRLSADCHRLFPGGEGRYGGDRLCPLPDDRHGAGGPGLGTPADRKQSPSFYHRGGSLMSDISNLASRIDAEFTVVEEKAKKLHTERMEEQKERQQRLEQLNKV